MEIVLALGIISFALVGIVGLFPVAMESAQESQRQTQATFIASRIFSDLSGEKPFIQKTGSAPSPTDQVDLSTNISTKVSYNENGMLPGADSSGAPGTDSAIYQASVEVLPNVPRPGIAQVQVEVIAPPVANATGGSRYWFVSLLNTAR